MSRVLLSGVALAALFAGTATAADLRAPYKAATGAPIFSWAGIYIGTHTGVAAGSTTSANVAHYGGFDAGVPLSYDLNPVGIFGGGQIGYNWQLGTVVFGAEFDGGYLGARSRVVQNDDLVEVKYGAYGALTGRAGLAFDRLMTYVKGGAAVASIKNTASDTDGSVIDSLDFSQVSKGHWGWTAGAGFEYAIAPNWTVKSEYLFMDFGREHSTNLDGDSFDHKNRLHTWKAGLNYRWGSPFY
jgi:outer membrane immunogenic protein